MIPFTQVIDLGADKTRMKDRGDVERQNETCRKLLERLYQEDSEGFSELQLLADEVGMGKTFVALAVAYSVLEAQRHHGALPGCIKKILVLVPRNDELMRKWQREVGEIIKRCVAEGNRNAAEAAFRSKIAERPDELAAALRDRKTPVVIAKTSALGARVQHEDLKIRFTLGTLFRRWGRSIPRETRRLLLKGARDWGWPADPEELTELSEEEEAVLPMKRRLVEKSLRLAVDHAELGSQCDQLLRLCKEWGTPFVRGREEGLDHIRREALQLYKEALWLVFSRDLPLVIVDEAHQWKNKRNDFTAFAKFVAPRARRALLLTATPFQLAPTEILSLLEVGDHLGTAPERHERLKDLRELVVKPALERAQAESQAFSKRWSALGSRLDPGKLADAWATAPLAEARRTLIELAREPGALSESQVEQVVQRVRHHIPPELREFTCQALRLFAFNRDLADELGRFVIRHRRATHHRLVRAGREIELARVELTRRPDAHVLHHSPGLDVRGDDELPLYLLMRATSELEQGKRTANLGCSLTGCYSTFFESAGSKAFVRADKAGRAKLYVDLLNSLVGNEAADVGHPKLRRVVREVVERWERGEKSLVFTFRVRTAERLEAIVREEVGRRLERRRLEAFGGEGGLKQLQQSLSSKTRTLMPIMLDRVLWSLLWAPPPGEEEPPFHCTDLRPTLADYTELARLSLVYEIDIGGKTPDRVFLHRAAENALAKRLRKDVRRGSKLRGILDRIAHDTWVERLYGGVDVDDESEHDELADERGVQSVYEASAGARQADVDRLARELLDRDAHATRTGSTAVVRQAFTGPSFWLGVDPETELLAREHHPADVEVDRSDQRFLHVQLRELTLGTGTGELDFRTRALAFKALRRALLRESILCRLLPQHEEREDEGWAQLLTKHFTQRGTGAESMLRRVAVFVEDLAASSGDISEPATARGGLYEATKNRDAVAITKGDTKNDTRSRRFQGFNTPLLPEILICGQIAQEGIDLHRHCSHVLHYDLAWNPATLEQRTGRVDRIGSRTQRLRQLAQDEPGKTQAGAEGQGVTELARLDVDAPYLAGTYDERMFEELRLRSQTFEVLLGGELAGSAAEASTSSDAAEGDVEGDQRAEGLIALPAEVTDSLRVDLSVWREAGPPEKAAAE